MELKELTRYSSFLKKYEYLEESFSSKKEFKNILNYYKASISKIIQDSNYSLSGIEKLKNEIIYLIFSSFHEGIINQECASRLWSLICKNFVTKIFNFYILRSFNSKILKNFFILGLGKIGVKDLNFTSDIDLIIFFDSKNSDIELSDFNKQYNLNLSFIAENGSSISGLNLIHVNLPEKVSLSRHADQIYKIYNKAFILNKLIDRNIGQDVIFSYKRASNILSNEINKNKIELENSTDPGLFKNDFEKKLYKRIQEIRKYFTSLGSREDCKKTLEVLADAKTDVSNFFDNVIVNDEDEAIKKNRLELMQLLCKTFNNYLNFSDIESA